MYRDTSNLLKSDLGQSAREVRRTPRVCSDSFQPGFCENTPRWRGGSGRRGGDGGARQGIPDRAGQWVGAAERGGILRMTFS